MEPFHRSWVDGTLVLELDSPGASVNVFGPPAAMQLQQVLSDLPAGTHTLVLRSRKPGSFINGAGLLYAHAMESPRRAIQVSAPVRGVYELLARTPLLSVAVIEGNCFGCGLELALCCDVRIAREVHETQFRMTELVDYRFVPLFGGTWRLPRTIGLQGARRLLLDGETFDAAAAARTGLVDAVLPNEGFEGALRAKLDGLRRGGWRPRRRPAPYQGSRAAPVPPPRRALWRLTDQLLEGSAQEPPARSRRRELAAFAETVTAPASKQAMSFFFIKHAARAASLGDAQRTPPRLGLRSLGRAPAGWRRLLESPSSVRPERSLALKIRGDVGTVKNEPVRIFFPWGLAFAAAEIACTRRTVQTGREVARALEWRGQEAVLTRPPRGFVSARLLATTRAALDGLIRTGVCAGEINRAMWDRGFAQPFRWKDWPTFRARRGAPAVWPLLAALWVAEISRAVASGALFHAAQGDVLVRALFDFPLEQGSLLRWASREGISSLLGQAEEAGAGPGLLSRLRQLGREEVPWQGA